MAAGSLACSFCTSVPSAWWMPDVKVAIAASILTGFVVAVGAAFTSGRREAALNAVAVALLLVLPGAWILAGMGTQVDGVVVAVPVDSDDGAFRVRCRFAFPAARIGPDGDLDLAQVCREAASTRRSASIPLALVGGLMVVGGLAAAVPRPRKSRRVNSVDGPTPVASPI